MIAQFFYSQWQQLRLLACVPQALLDHGWACAPRRLLIFLIIFPLLWLINLIHFMGFALDAVLFPRWRNQRVKQPVFIVGVPRSGTTFLHRFLAEDSRFTYTPTWEVLLAPSICEKFLWRFLLKSLAPLLGALRRAAPGFFKQMDGIHKLGLDEAEEDFLFLLSLNACFILIALFPQSQSLWRLARLDWDLPAWERKLIVGFYRDCVKKHLFFVSKSSPQGDMVYLSKNPSFSSWLKTLSAHFDNARFVVCLREPEVVLLSQISSLMPAFAFLGSRRRYPPGFNAACVTMLVGYYRHLQEFTRARPSVPVIHNETLRYQLPEVTEMIFEHLNMSVPSAVLHKARETVRAVEPGKAPTDYRVDGLNLNAQQIQFAFKDVWPVHV